MALYKYGTFVGSLLLLFDAETVLNAQQNAIRASFVSRERLVWEKGALIKLGMAESSLDYESQADVVYMQRRADFHISFFYLKNTEWPANQSAIRRRDFSLTGTQYRDMNYFTGQGVISVDPDSAGERILDINIILPTQFWLDYRDAPLSSLFDSADPVFDKSNMLLTFVLEYGKLELTLNPEWKLLPKHAKFFNRQGMMMREVIINKAKIFMEDGIYYPEVFSSQMLGAGLDNKPVPVNKVNWTVESIKPLEKNALAVTFPDGAIVADNSNGTGFRAGNPPKYFKKAQENPKKSDESDQTNVTPFWSRRTLFGLAALTLVVAFLCLRLWSMRSTRPSSPHS